MILFSLRALTRSRQHPLAFALYLNIVLAIALGTIQYGIAVSPPDPLGAVDQPGFSMFRSTK